MSSNTCNYCGSRLQPEEYAVVCSDCFRRFEDEAEDRTDAIREAKIEGAKDAVELLRPWSILCPRNATECSAERVGASTDVTCRNCWLAALERGEWPPKETPCQNT